jgi:hypothetical protein
MGKNKQQVATEARAKKSTPEVQPAEQPTAKPQEAQPAVEPVKAAAATPAQPSKQQVTLDKLKEAWAEKKVDLSKMTVTMDGKYMLVVPAKGWPVIQIGNSGGVVLPQIRSYAKAWDAAVDGLAVFTKQNERDARKAASAAPPATQPAAKAPAAEKQLQTA